MLIKGTKSFMRSECFKCLGDNNRGNQCPQSIMCGQCGQRNHHSLMHFESFKGFCPGLSMMSQRSFTTPSASSIGAVVPKISSNTVASWLWQVAYASPVIPSNFASNGGTNAITNVLSGGGSNVASNISSSGTSASVSSGPSSGAATGVQPAKVSLSAVSSKEDKCYRPILPVQIKFANGKKAFTYALLDSGSNCTVMTNAFIKRMGAPTRQEMISLQELGVVSTGARMVGEWGSWCINWN